MSRPADLGRLVPEPISIMEGGTNTTSFGATQSLIKYNPGGNNLSPATSQDISNALGAVTVANATQAQSALNADNAAVAAQATTFVSGEWSIVVGANGNLNFVNLGTVVASLSPTGNFEVTSDITAFGTP